MEDEDADLIAAKLASIQEAEAAGIPVLEDLDEALAKTIEEQEKAALALSLDDIPDAPPAPKLSTAKKGAAGKAAKTAPKEAVPNWRNYVYVEFAFAASDVKEGIVVALDYNQFAEGAPMTRIGDKYYQTLALGCGKTFKYKVRPQFSLPTL